MNAAVLQRPSDRPVTPPRIRADPSAARPTQDPNSSANTPLPPITLQTQQQGQGALPPITLQPAPGNQPGGLPPITLQPGGNQPGRTAPDHAGDQTGPTVRPEHQGRSLDKPRPASGHRPSQVPDRVPVAPFPGQTGPGGLPGGIQTGVPPGFRIDANGQLVPIAPAAGQGVPDRPQTSRHSRKDPRPAVRATARSARNSRKPACSQVPVQGSPSAALTRHQPAADHSAPDQPHQTVTTPVTSGNQVGAIAGIASTHKGPSIKIYKDQTQV